MYLRLLFCELELLLAAGPKASGRAFMFRLASSVSRRKVSCEGAGLLVKIWSAAPCVLLRRSYMDKDVCECVELIWECWIKEYDSDIPSVAPSLWFSTECASCGAKTFKPHAELDESAIPENILERGLMGLRRFGEKK